jgi:cytoskeletal protein CcmA (bactofilin family)
LIGGEIAPEKDLMGRKRFKAPKVSTVIGKDTTIRGAVEFEGGLHLDGRIEGNVNGKAGAPSSITVSEHGAVEGDVRVDVLILNGTVVGDVYADERVELAAKARVNGTVYYRLLEMAMGAEVNGQLVRSEEREPRMLGLVGEADEPEQVITPRV